MVNLPTLCKIKMSIGIVIRSVKYLNVFPESAQSTKSSIEVFDLIDNPRKGLVAGKGSPVLKESLRGKLIDIIMVHYYWSISIWKIVFLVLPAVIDPTVNCHQLAKRHLVVTSTRNPLIKDKELVTVTTGVMEEMILDILSEKMNFTFEVRPPSDILSPGYILPNGSWTGTSGQLQRKEVDMCVTTSALASAKRPIMDTSFPVIFSDSAIMIPFPSEEHKVWVSFIFQLPAWIVIGVFFVTIILTTWIIHRITTSNPNGSQRYLDYWIIFFVSVWASQGIAHRNSSVHYRLLCASSFLGIFVISNYFTASYTSMLSIPIFEPTVNSVEDLAYKEPAIKTLLVKGSSTDELILASTDPTLKKIGDQMRQYPERRITNSWTVEDISTIVKDDNALVILKENGESLIQNSYVLNNKTCRVTLAEKTFFRRPQTFTYPKNSPIVADIDMYLLRMHQAGLIQYAERRSAISYNRCSMSEMTKVVAKKAIPLKMGNLIGVFCLLAVGMAISFLVFISELVIAKIKKKRIASK